LLKNNPMMRSEPVIRLSKTLGKTPNLAANTMHLLLIEDDPALRTALQRSLVRASMRVDVCGDGAVALGIWSTLQPDVVVLDLSLPGKDGLEVLQQARKTGLNTPVLILTARGTVGDRVCGPQCRCR
jgi:two-component system response regulator TctD